MSNATFKSYFYGKDKFNSQSVKYIQDLEKFINSLNNNNGLQNFINSLQSIDDLEKVISALVITTMKFKAYYELPPSGDTKHPHQAYYWNIFQRWELVSNRIKAIIKTGVTKNDQSQNLSQSFTQLSKLLQQIMKVLFFS